MAWGYRGTWDTQGDRGTEHGWHQGPERQMARGHAGGMRTRGQQGGHPAPGSTRGCPWVTARPRRPWASRWSSCPTSPAPSPTAPSPAGWNEPPRPPSTWAARWALGGGGDGRTGPWPPRGREGQGDPAVADPVLGAGGGRGGHDQPARHRGAGLRQGPAHPDLLLPPQPHHHPGGAGPRPHLPPRPPQLHGYDPPPSPPRGGALSPVSPCPGGSLALSPLVPTGPSPRVPAGDAAGDKREDAVAGSEQGAGLALSNPCFEDKDKATVPGQG